MPNNNNTAILFSHVTLGYENIVTTPDLNLTIHPGDYICLIGAGAASDTCRSKRLRSGIFRQVYRKLYDLVF